MKVYLGLVLVLTCVYAHENFEDFINEINSKQNLWTAGKNFRNRHFSDYRGLLGGKKTPEHILRTVPVIEHEIIGDELPESFDAREKWPECPTIGEIKDQSACEAGWSVAVTSVIADRICIHSNGTLKPEISARHLTACDGLSTGCVSGYPLYAYLYWRRHGIVTGGAYGSNVGCQPYPFPPCEHGINGSKPLCPADLYRTPKCEATCDNSSLVFEKELFFGGSQYRVRTVKQIQKEILKHGPVSADFYAFADFITYKSGVYTRTTDEVKGVHVVKLIGWGVENGTEYWLGVNSWNQEWGDKGFFKMRRGVNECDIEYEVFAGQPKLT